MFTGSLTVDLFGVDRKCNHRSVGSVCTGSVTLGLFGVDRKCNRRSVWSNLCDQEV